MKLEAILTALLCAAVFVLLPTRSQPTAVADNQIDENCVGGPLVFETPAADVDCATCANGFCRRPTLAPRRSAAQPAAEAPRRERSIVTNRIRELRVTSRERPPRRGFFRRLFRRR